MYFPGSHDEDMFTGHNDVSSIHWSCNWTYYNCILYKLHCEPVHKWNIAVSIKICFKLCHPKINVFSASTSKEHIYRTQKCQMYHQYNGHIIELTIIEFCKKFHCERIHEQHFAMSLKCVLKLCHPKIMYSRRVFPDDTWWGHLYTTQWCVLNTLVR